MLVKTQPVCSGKKTYTVQRCRFNNMQVQREWLFHPRTLTGPWFQTAHATTCGKTVALQEFPLCPHARSVCGREDILCTGILSNTKNKETKQKQEKPFSKTARRDGAYDNHNMTATAQRCWGADAKNLTKFTIQSSLNMFNWSQINLSCQLYSINKTSRLLQSDSRNPNLSRLRSENITTKVTHASPEPLHFLFPQHAILSGNLLSGAKRGNLIEVSGRWLIASSVAGETISQLTSSSQINSLFLHDKIDLLVEVLQ